jgi:methionyl-tRNA synthetase
VPYYVTTPIYYVNGEPHLGHVYTTVAADVLARHMRQRGDDVFFLTGTDEHGEPVAQAAEREGVTPRELAERNAERFKEVARRVEATNDFFIRTSDPEHEAVVAEIATRLQESGHVYQGLYEGWYCPRCADFKTDNEVLDGNKCPIHLIELDREQEENWFFRLSAFEQPLRELYADRPDALLNYYSALRYARPGEDLSERFWPPTVHLIAKDILKFHAIIWPALLMAAGLEQPRTLFIHGYLLMDDHKMSKSLGNVLDPFEAMDVYGTDALRYYLLREVSFGQDGSISPEGFETRYTTELANEYGNLASRTLAMIVKYRDGVVPEAEPAPELAELFGGLAAKVCERIDRVEVSAALEDVWERVRALNRYVADSEPWKLAKDEGAAAELDVVLYTLAEGLRVTSVLLAPWMPATADRLLAALGRTDLSLETAELGAFGGGATLGELGQLFPRIEPRAEAETPA